MWNNFFGELVTVFWYFLPAGVANVVPILVAKMPYLENWNTPVDCGVKLGGVRLLGDHKTWRGVLFGVTGAGLTFLITFSLVGRLNFAGPDLRDVVYNFAFLFGCWIGLGALVGDAVKSFFKRKMKIAPGKSWYFFDQVDYVLGASVFTFWIVPLPWYDYLLGMFFWGIVSLGMSYIGYLVRFKKSPV